LAVVFIAMPACSLIVDTRCFEGECADGSILEGGSDVLDATLGDGDPCAFDADPCLDVWDDFGGCYCGSSLQSGFDPGHANTSCLYRCVDHVAVHHTDKTHFCTSGCLVAPTGTADYCNNEPCDAGPGFCNVYCGGP
jgi:hypothetical protein